MQKIPFSVYDFFGYLAAGFVLMVAADYTFDGGRLAHEIPTLITAVFWIVVAYMLGHITAHLSSVLLEKGLLRRVLGSPEQHLFEKKCDSRWAYIFPGNFKPFPRTTQERILNRANEEGVEAPGRGFFFHCHAIVKRDRTTRERLNTFLNLYGFCRNASMALLIAALVLVFGAFGSFDWQAWEGLHGQKLAWAGGALAVSVGMFYRYLKFFRHYTMEVFITYPELSKQTSNES